MKNIVITVASGMGALIFAYLLFSNGNSAVALTNAVGGNINSGVKTLQGR
jgi:hypothetical protein